MSSPRRRIPAWAIREMYRRWVLERSGEFIGDGPEELTEEERQRIEKSKAWHPSQGHTMEA
jgi:hypothetical protein